MTDLQELMDSVAKDWGISPEFREASDHPYTCRCDGCKDWWRKMGPDDDEGYGPFTREEIEGGHSKDA